MDEAFGEKNFEWKKIQKEIWKEIHALRTDWQTFNYV